DSRMERANQKRRLEFFENGRFVTAKMEFQTPGIQADFRLAGALSGKIPAQQEPAEQFGNQRRHPQHSFENQFCLSDLDLRIHLSMTPRLEIRKAAMNERIGLNEPVI